jgi:hypothetical protein
VPNYYRTRDEARREAARRNARAAADMLLRFAPVPNPGETAVDLAHRARGENWKLITLRPTRQLPRGLRPS